MVSKKTQTGKFKGSVCLKQTKCLYLFRIKMIPKVFSPVCIPISTFNSILNVTETRKHEFQVGNVTITQIYVIAGHCDYNTHNPQVPSQWQINQSEAQNRAVMNSEHIVAVEAKTHCHSC